MTTRFHAMVPSTLALLTLALAPAPARADTVPSLDVEQTCRSAQVANTSISDQANYDGCLRSEREAKKEAERHWGNYTPAAKRQCQNQFKAGGYPSYVEMVTCLELASGTVPTQSTEGGQAVGGPGSPRDVKAQREGGANLTKEPPASQRTNPMKVLDNN
ncbi:hypothetical protein SAMN05216360_101206 [Methylobacterium phyllostachyos]|uniref:Uncharacterized protein n=1 Tax=Methylobacterium phyllostachyos TaxID=582672 RepID=A0A1G9RF65_9HYPH|nr:hypothetical protein [Methylobacterium phyllostachyos]SDM21105.1 hypothetical protein SAMN05216360_101206 [Methylobacterium phyllostachyos]